MVSLTPDDGWCDDPTDPAYNRLIKTPYLANHEVLWRIDHVYDILIVVGYNDSPPIPPKGSAIFIHIMNDRETPTDGCIAFSRGDLIDILSEISPTTQLVIPPHLDQTVSPLFSNPLQEKYP
jgi:L,D-peptidoglycan transpeptidase YkuD (ErfK/YbiS/YcfS/YnhG family)